MRIENVLNVIFVFSVPVCPTIQRQEILALESGMEHVTKRPMSLPASAALALHCSSCAKPDLASLMQNMQSTCT